MKWIFVALLSGNVVTSEHQTEEACLGRKAIFEKNYKANSKCVEFNSLIGFSSGSITLTPSISQ